MPLARSFIISTKKGTWEMLESSDPHAQESLMMLQSWLFACHRSRFSKAGDYHTFSIAGKPFFIVLGRDLKLRAFHNVCRHRAYTVVRRTQGSSLRFSCKYHGWQYDSLGQLVKAPQFEDTIGFDPEKNGLYEIMLHVDMGGFIFVKFATSAGGPPVWTSSPKNYGGLCHWESFDIQLGLNWRFAGMEMPMSRRWL
jgi:phenylpropionate dioxygenase-like ring-hydroxylating dioxygenase large terminal subunit